MLRVIIMCEINSMQLKVYRLKKIKEIIFSLLFFCNAQVSQPPADFEG